MDMDMDGISEVDIFEIEQGGPEAESVVGLGAYAKHDVSTGLGGDQLMNCPVAQACGTLRRLGDVKKFRDDSSHSTRYDEKRGHQSERDTPFPYWGPLSLHWIPFLWQVSQGRYWLHFTFLWWQLLHAVIFTLWAAGYIRK